VADLLVAGESQQGAAVALLVEVDHQVVEVDRRVVEADLPVVEEDLPAVAVDLPEAEAVAADPQFHSACRERWAAPTED
jgi:hypothetical protein